MIEYLIGGEDDPPPKVITHIHPFRMGYDIPNVHKCDIGYLRCLTLARWSMGNCSPPIVLGRFLDGLLSRGLD